MKGFLQIANKRWSWAYRLYASAARDKKSPSSTSRSVEITWARDKFAPDLIQDSPASP